MVPAQQGLEQVKGGESMTGSVKQSPVIQKRRDVHTNAMAVAMSDASTRSGSPSSSQGAQDAVSSRRSSRDAVDPGILQTNPAPAAAVPCHGSGYTLSSTSPVKKPLELSLAATMGDASQRQPGTPVSSPSKMPAFSPSKMQSFTGECGTRLLLPIAGFARGGELFQTCPAGTPAATPLGQLVRTSPPSYPASPCRGKAPASSGDASERTPLMSPMASHNPAVMSMLCGSPCGRLPSGPELAELLHSALPETYDD